MQSYGRTVIYTNFTENDVLLAEENDQIKIIKQIIDESMPTFEKNKREIEYLQKVYSGEQDILTTKKKYTREEIDNKSVENWLFAFIDFKKTYLLAKPIRYVQYDGEENQEIVNLNKFMQLEDKKTKDMLLYEDCLMGGNAYRYNNFNLNTDEDEDKAPFEIINLFPTESAVVYSSEIGNPQVLSFIAQNKVKVDENGAKTNYIEVDTYIRNKRFVFNNISGEFELQKQKVGNSEQNYMPLLANSHVITEWYTNKQRLSLYEIAKSIFDDINLIESLDMDDLEQFVNAIMVFFNSEIDEIKFDEMKRLGALLLNSANEKPADVKYLTHALGSAATQTLYSRKLTALHQILGVPLANDAGTVSYGDTGKAKMTGQGYTSAGIRAEGDENMIEMCDKNSLKTILKICKLKLNGEIKDLKLNQIDLKFQRTMTDNLLVKTQALLNMLKADVPREYANTIISLFNDPHAVTQAQEKLFGTQTTQQGASLEEETNIENDTNIDEQNNNIEDTLEQQNQGE